MRNSIKKILSKYLPRVLHELFVVFKSQSLKIYHNNLQTDESRILLSIARYFELNYLIRFD